MGSRRLGWAGGRGGGCGGCPLPEPTRPMPIPVASIDLTLEELLNLLVDVFSFFLFCYIEKKKEKEVHGGQIRSTPEARNKMMRRNGRRGRALEVQLVRVRRTAAS